MDLNYPLSYDGAGIALTDSDNARVKHLLDTYQRERVFAPNFGVPLDLLFNAAVPDLVTERVRLALAQLTDIKAVVTLIESGDGTIKLRVEIGGTVVESSTIPTGR